MKIGPAETKGTDRGLSFFAHPGQRHGTEIKRVGRRAIVRVRLLDVQSRWNNAVIERKARFDNAGKARSTLRMTDLGFHRTQSTLPIQSSGLEEYRTQS